MMADLIAYSGKFLLKDLPRSLFPETSFPLDARSLFSSREGAEAEVKDAVEVGERGSCYYFGQQICVVTKTEANWYVIVRGDDGKGTLKPLIASVRIDPTTKNWVINGTDTGVCAEGQENPIGPPGDPGPPGPAGETGVTAPISGFFTMSVDVDGNIYTHSRAPKAKPNFKYDQDSGNLYFVVEETGETLIGNVKGPKGDSVDEAEILKTIQGYILKNGISLDENVILNNYYTKEQSEKKFVARDEIPDPKEVAAKEELYNKVASPSNGFFNMFVDDNGDLWLYSVDGKSTPVIEFHAATGDLYFVPGTGGVIIIDDGIPQGDVTMYCGSMLTSDAVNTANIKGKCTDVYGASFVTRFEAGCDRFVVACLADYDKLQVIDLDKDYGGDVTSLFDFQGTWPIDGVMYNVWARDTDRLLSSGYDLEVSVFNGG